MVVTTRMHGLVLALKNGVPALAVDPIIGGAKVTAQAGAWTWPAVLAAGALTEAGLGHWWDWCRSEQGHAQAARCQLLACQGSLLEQLLQAITET